MRSAILLDTHAWLWLTFDERERASAHAWKEIEAAAVKQGVAVSDISFWEVALKSQKRILDVGNVREWLKRARHAPGLGVIEVDRSLLVDSALLDYQGRDPADRILIATALRYDLRLATADAPIIEYAERQRALKVLDMRAG